MSDIIGWTIYGVIFTAVTVATGKAAYQLYKNGQKEKPIELKWNERKQMYC